MKQPNALETEWIKMLDSQDEDIILNTLHEIRNSGSVSMLPYIIRLLAITQNDNVRIKILQFIADFKTQEAVPYIMEALDKLEKHHVIPELLSTCWQSGLDFSKHLPWFADVFIRGDYQTSLEAFTVIEESLPTANDTIKTECLINLKSVRQSIPQTKQRLLLELIKIFEDS